MTTDDLAQLLRDAREESHLTADDIAAAVGVHRSTIWRWERGELLSTVADYLSALDACSVKVVRGERVLRICIKPH